MISENHSDYRLKDWKYVQFEQTFYIPEKFQLSELIADKSMSHTVLDLKEACMKNGTIGEGYKRHVIYNWLNSNYNDPVAFLKDIEKNGFSPEDELCGFFPKEKELKIFARFFGMLPFRKRLYVVLTEAMIANNILSFFPEITMSFDAVTLMTRIYQNTINTALETQDPTIITNLDFMKWNSYMRREETNSIFKDLDDLFGLENVFLRTHDLFEGSAMYLADGTLTPIDRNGEWINDDRIWFDHLGGVAGLRQKGWTIFTVLILKYIAEMNGINCQLMGQGDNQVLITNYKGVPKDQIYSLHETFLLSLTHFLDYIGPPLKPEETWSSSNFFIRNFFFSSSYVNNL